MIPTIVQCCSDSQLIKLFKGVQWEASILKYMNVKVGCYLVVALARRNHAPTIDALRTTIRRYGSRVVLAHCFKLFMEQLIEEPYFLVVSIVAEALVFMDFTEKEKLLMHKNARGIYLHFTLSALTMVNSPYRSFFISREIHRFEKSPHCRTIA